MAGYRAGNITVFRKKRNWNIGLVLFGAVFIYLVVTVLFYLTGSHVSAYEVREGSIQRDNAYTGLVVRSEQVVTAPEDGYVNYFALEGSKVGAKTNVYSLSPDKLDFAEADGAETEELQKEEQDEILLKTQDFTEDFRAEQFDEVYQLQADIEEVLQNKTTQSRQAQLDEMLASGTEGLTAYRASTPGIVVYATDGYEGITISDVTEDMITNRDYEPEALTDNEKVKAGDPVYKVITDDTWTLVIVLEDEIAGELAQTERVKVQFSKDHESAVADFALYNTPEANLGFLTFDSSMVRYAKERFLDIELILEDESGLKIPRSAVVKKSFYAVPEAYLTQGGDDSEPGVLVAGAADADGSTARFQAAEVYYRDNQTGMVYLDADAFEKNAVLVKTDSAETYTMEQTETLRGVYNINKGYAEFKAIEYDIRSESEEYYIVEGGSNYGLSNYDRIALNGKDVQENDVVL